MHPRSGSQTSSVQTSLSAHAEGGLGVLTQEPDTHSSVVQASLSLHSVAVVQVPRSTADIMSAPAPASSATKPRSPITRPSTLMSETICIPMSVGDPAHSQLPNVPLLEHVFVPGVESGQVQAKLAPGVHDASFVLPHPTSPTAATIAMSAKGAACSSGR